MNTQKLHALMEAIKTDGRNFDRIDYWFYRRYDQNEYFDTEIERVSDSLTVAFILCRADLLPGEKLLGKAFEPLSESEALCLNEWKKTYGDNLARFQGNAKGLTPNYPLLLRNGIYKIQREMEKKFNLLSGDERLLYKAYYDAFESVVRYARQAEFYTGGAQIKETDAVYKKELQTASLTLRRVPLYSARNFREAIQSVFFVAHFLLFAPGAPELDVFAMLDALLPYYETDVATGNVAREEAEELLVIFACKLNHLANGVVSKALEKDSSNPLLSIIKEFRELI